METAKRKKGFGLSALVLSIGMVVAGAASPAFAASWRTEHLVVGGGIGCATIEWSKTAELKKKGATGIKWTGCYTASNGAYMKTVTYYL